MVVKNKKNGTNILTYREGASFVRVPIKANETVDIAKLFDFNDVINKQDFGTRGWFEVVNKKTESVNEDSALEKAKKEVKEYTSKKKQNIEE